jgi:hypothetical protein
MRKKIMEEMISEVYGPRGGVEEKIYSDPWKEYVSGIIIPKRWTPEEVSDPDSEMINSDDSGTREDDKNDSEISPNIPSQLDPKMRPKSFGISFVVNKETSLDVCITWARYFEGSDENKKKLWSRKPYFKRLRINDENEIPLYKESDGSIHLRIRSVKWNGNIHKMISFVNDLNSPNDYRPSVSSCIFQPSIRINMPEDTVLVDPARIIDADKKLYYLYRKKPARARGHMCSAVWKEIDYMDDEILDTSILWPDGMHFQEECVDFIRPDLRTEFVPLNPIPAPSFLWEKEYGNRPEMSALKLSQIWNVNDIINYLMPIADGYKSWIEENKIKADQDSEIQEDLIKQQKIALKRIIQGIEILKNDINARLAFCFANRTIYLQNSWNNSGDFSWRPFQLAFFLMNLESITNEKSPDRETLDLLWIPTGGGKTEAYMGIMAFTIALRRIKAVRGITTSVTGAGTSVISRYTLRILTVQQFRRTLKMVTAAEFLRNSEKDGKRGWRPYGCDIADDLIYGSTRFSVGMWVGGAVSPNHLRKKDKGALDALMGKEGIIGEPAQIMTCPVCDSILSIPESGLSRGHNIIHVVAEGNLKEGMKNKTLEELIESIKFVNDLKVVTNNHRPGFLTLSIDLYSDSEIRLNDLRNIWKNISKKLKLKEASLSFERPGYFGSIVEECRRKKNFRDFEIWCTNPECDLNHDVIWNEGVPISSSDFKYPDGLYERIFWSPFIKDTRIPIPAYTVDEQIYSRCPTIIISTADKIARLSFEPRAAALFGTVDRYNPYYGYRRDDLYPKDYLKSCLSDDKKIKSFLPPDLIVQDELHLIDGPLGSMFGLYEAIVDAIIKVAGGSPKFIASTATIKNAHNQVKMLFAKNLFQFPPYGLDIDDSFFVKEISFKEGWHKTQPGRIYMGIYAPGMGPMTPPIRIWSRALKVPNDNLDSPELKYFWTLVGYFNAIRELGGGRALYREDIEERINDISKETVRNLDQERVVELSSRIESTKVPLVLSELENDGIMGHDQVHPFNDAIFTTSMFGTGVDISHLSMMIVNGQPKTTGSYIQATGRIGRSHGGLVITFLRAGRPRDLSHYEMFCAYHQRIHLGVEPVSVSPYSEGALMRALGPSAVAFYRNISKPTVKWYGDNGKIILNDEEDLDLSKLIYLLDNRLQDVDEEERTKIINKLNSLMDLWKEIAIKTDNLAFSEYPWKKPQNNVVLGDPAHEHYNKKVVYEKSPQSLREIEETTVFRV